MHAGVVASPPPPEVVGGDEDEDPTYDTAHRLPRESPDAASPSAPFGGVAVDAGVACTLCARACDLDAHLVGCAVAWLQRVAAV